MLKETGCDAIMVGRGILGNPWLIKEIDYYLNKGIIRDKPNDVERVEMAIRHLKNLSEQKIEKLAVLEIRNHIAWYLKGLKGSNEIKNEVYKYNNIDDIMNILNEYKERIKEEFSES